LGALAAGADVSYAELGQLIGLSAPAVHDRVKKLRLSGCLRRTVALPDTVAIGKPLLAFVHVDSAGWGDPGRERHPQLHPPVYLPGAQCAGRHHRL
jgi:DNA-binding Lrp family transcriptional regulator